MRSIQLQAALTEFVEAAAGHLQAAVAAGAEVPFELDSQRSRAAGRGGPSLYCYRALTAEFIAERQAELERLASHDEAARLLGAYDGLDRYLAGVGAEVARANVGARVRAAIRALLCEVFAEQSDFELHPERLTAALQRLEHAAFAGGGQATLVATLHGLTITTPELRLTRGLTIAHARVLDGLPDGAVGAGADGESEPLIVVLGIEQDDPRLAIANGRDVLRDLLRALRLFGDGRVTLGALAWTRLDGGSWQAIALGMGGRPRGMLVISAEQEDELRAFCNLVSRRAPHGNELAWALRRFELGCERDSSYDALSDHLLALRALLEPEGPASGLLAARLAALCATPERRPALSERTLHALALERDTIAGAATPHAGTEALANELSDHLRSLLRDVICGHLDGDLVGLADRLLLEQSEPDEPFVPDAPEAEITAVRIAGERDAGEAPRLGGSPRAGDSVQQVLGDLGEADEILDVFI